MRTMRVGSVNYVLTGSEPWDALAHASGAAFIELQQLEFTIISYLAQITHGEDGLLNGFDVFASKTFGNLLRALEKHDYLRPLVAEMADVKERRDFFIHRFLFNRFGGELTTDNEFEELIRDAIVFSEIFNKARNSFHDFMFDNAPLVMFAAKRDPKSGEYKFIESKFSTLRAD